MTDKQETRRLYRVELFEAQGFEHWRAQMWSWRLVHRDADRDDRRLCVECHHLLSGWRCRRHEAVLPDTLQRCPSFEWERP